MTLKVAIWDDRPKSLSALNEGVSTASKSVAQLVAFKVEDIERSIESLMTAYEESRPLSGSELSQFDVLCIDFDLRSLQGHKWLTADSLASLIPVFTGCPLVIVMNRPPLVDFDLTLQESWDARGVLTLRNERLMERSFWLPGDRGKPSVFHPWHWPHVAATVKNFKRRIAKLATLDYKTTAVLELLDFGGDRRTKLSRRALGALSPKLNLTEKYKLFDYIVDGARSLLPDKLKELKRSLESDVSRKLVDRLLAADLSSWLTQFVVAGQDVLVDAPHVVARAPWLLKEFDTKLTTWNGTVGSKPSAAMKKWVDGFKYKQGMWLDRDVYWWDEIRDSPQMSLGFKEYNESDPQTENVPVFLEDRGCFVRSSEAQRFTAAFGNIWDRRHIATGDLRRRYVYAPLVRTAL